MSVRVESVGDAVVVTIDRPSTRNAIDPALARDLGAAVRLASQDPQVRGVVISSTGPTFLAGADVNMLVELTQREGGDAELLEIFEDVAICERCDVPVVAAVQGDVYGGGCELLLLCDLVIVEEHAELAFRHAKMGLAPAWGGMSRLIERVGPLEATRLLLTSEKIDAAEARRINLVNEVVARGTSRARALARVARIAENPRATVAAMKRALRELNEARRAALGVREREREVFSERWGGPDHQQAMRAFFARK